MKTCSFLVTFSLAIVLVNAFSTEEHVKRFFRPEHRPFLPAITSLRLREDEANRAPAPLDDDSTKCLAYCEPECKKLEVPDFLTVNIILLNYISVFFNTHLFYLPATELNLGIFGVSATFFYNLLYLDKGCSRHRMWQHR